MYLTLRLFLALLLVSVQSIAIAQERASLTRAEVRDAERRLSDLGYWTGAIDGRFDPASQSALIAFQKWEGRTITGELTFEQIEAIRTAASPKAKDIGYAHVEVDLDRQVMMFVDEEGSVRVLPVSTGNGKPFVDEGENSVAYTPRGRFIVYEKEVGWHTGSLGSVYYANFISGGVAIHGSRNVPVQPASHGCIRVPMFAAREVSKLMPMGRIVLVYDKVSFVSARDWINNPNLKQAAMAISAATDDIAFADTGKNKFRSPAIKRTRPRIVRAD